MFDIINASIRIIMIGYIINDIFFLLSEDKKINVILIIVNRIISILNLSEIMYLLLIKV